MKCEQCHQESICKVVEIRGLLDRLLNNPPEPISRIVCLLCIAKGIRFEVNPVTLEIK